MTTQPRIDEFPDQPGRFTTTADTTMMTHVNRRADVADVEDDGAGKHAAAKEQSVAMATPISSASSWMEQPESESDHVRETEQQLRRGGLLGRLLAPFSSSRKEQGDFATATAIAKSSETDLSSSDDERPPTPPLPPADNKPDAGPDPPYHVFTTRKKWQIVYIVSLAGLFSPLSSNIYFPALGDIAKGLAPSFWGPLSDTRGRRITFIGTFAVYLVANIALAFSDDEFEILMAFRAVQAAGSAATISVGAGVIGDITTAKERGGFMGSFGGIRMLGQAVGPVIGGIVTEYFGFHAIFWLLFILGSIALALVVLFLPETLRRIAGNGTIPLRGINRPIVYQSLKKDWTALHPDDDPNAEPEKAPQITLSSVLSPLRFLFEKDVFCTLLFGAVVYAIWSSVTSSSTALFQPRYNLSDLQVGLIFLPNGAGCILGSYLTGKILDRDYRTVEAQYRLDKGLPADAPVSSKKTADFPVSQARLRSAWYQVLIFVASIGGYGYAITSPVLGTSPSGMAVPLVLQFIIAFTATGLFTQNSALMVDLYPGASASATAVNNLIRCAIGAAGVAAVQFIIDAIGAGPTFLMFAGVTVALSPLLYLEWVFGNQWRMARMERLEREAAEKNGVDGGESGKSA
ncbi:major facilitator superfamily domain-containing protein [Chaetomium sp. MPI-SDFR-AT-0129]|nr:major facilitator superfamily domain-containing protein [Chaetomium sp. MPI-SDFR-AT-0129]